MIADLSGERPPDGAVKTVQAVVSRLRRALGGEAARLVSSAAGYRLRVEPDELDLGRFERLCADGGARWRPGATSARRRGCARRWAEWRGPPLADVAFEPFAAPEVARLEDLRAAAVEDRVEADLAMGRGAELVAELEGLVAASRCASACAGSSCSRCIGRASRRGAGCLPRRGPDAGQRAGLRPGPELERLQQAILAQIPLYSCPGRRGAARAGASPRDGHDPGRRGRGLGARGDAGADRVRAAHDRRLRDVLAAHGASAVKAVGDAHGGRVRVGRAASPAPWRCSGRSIARLVAARWRWSCVSGSPRATSRGRARIIPARP